MLTLRLEEIRMLEDESFNEFYAKLLDIVNFRFNIRENSGGIMKSKEDFEIPTRKISAKSSIWPLEMQKSFSPLWKSICSLKSHLIAQFAGISDAINTLQGWHHGSGSFIANAHEFFRVKGNPVGWHRVVWEQWSLPWYNFIIWLTVLGKLRTKDRLNFLSIDSICVLYNREEESHAHLFFSCDWTSLLWSRVKQRLRLNRSMSSLSGALRGLSGRSKGLHQRMRRVALPLLVHLIWNERNKRLFEHVSKSVDAVFWKFQVQLFMVLHFH